MPASENAKDLSQKSLLDILHSTKDQYHSSLSEVSAGKPCLFVFLRRLGCCFCAETLSDIRLRLPAIDATGAKVVLIHMSPENEASQIFARYGLADLSRVSDPEASLYTYFGLKKMELGRLFSAQAFYRAAESLLCGHFISGSAGDSMQLHGVFLIDKSKIVRAFRAKSADDRPDYLRIASPASVPSVR